MKSGFALQSLALSLALILPACAAPTSFAGVSFADQATPPSIRDLASRAQSGDKEAMYELGLAYEQGDALPKDEKRARSLYRAAATTTGGTIYVYVPGPKGKAGYVTPVNTGPVRYGLAKAKARLAALKAVATADKK